METMTYVTEDRVTDNRLPGVGWTAFVFFLVDTNPRLCQARSSQQAEPSVRQDRQVAPSALTQRSAPPSILCFVRACDFSHCQARYRFVSLNNFVAHEKFR